MALTLWWQANVTRKKKKISKFCVLKKKDALKIRASIKTNEVIDKVHQLKPTNMNFLEGNF